MGRKKRTQYLLYIALVVIGILCYLRLQELESFKNQKKYIPKGIILELIGGLGNQLYIYSAGKLMQKSLGTEIYLVSPSEDIQFKNMHSTIDYRKVLFKDFISIERDAKEFSDKEDVRLEYTFWASWSPDTIPSTSKYVWIPQHWYQHYRSIESVIPEVRNSINSLLKSLYQEVKVRSGAAFIHVRRGDYTLKGNDTYLLDMDYYNKGLDILNKTEGIEVYHIFSDDIKWCREQKWNTDISVEYIDEQDEMKALYMMSQCRSGAVIANSTFSTWGAILGAQEARAKIIYPSKWLYGANTEFPSSWIRI